MSDTRGGDENPETSPEDVAWATRNFTRAIESAGNTKSETWAALRDRILTVNGATLALSLVALQIADE